MEHVRTVIRFLYSGSISSVATLVVVVILTEVFSLWYVLSSIGGNVVGGCVNFYLQKNHTFRDFEKKNTFKKFWLFNINLVSDMGLNPSLMYFFVDDLGIWYVFAQCLILGLLAIKNFLVFKFFIFKTIV